LEGVIAVLLMAGLALHAGATPTDSSLALRRGDHVVIRDLGGEVRVETWDRAVLGLEGEDRSARALSVSRTGDRVLVEPGAWKGRRLDVVLKVRVPPWVALDVQGRELDVTVSGVGGGVSVRNVSGDIRVDGTSGDLDLTTVEGEIEVTNARGRVSAHSRGDDVSLSHVVGDVDAVTGDGDIRLDDVRAASLGAQTLDGDVYFAGPFVSGGTYSFSVHDGDATLVIPRASGARVKVSTFDGEFSSSFPVTLQRYSGQGRFEFTLGDGSAGVDVEVFDGQIRILDSPPPGRHRSRERGGS
jgi:Toastrack DUF4097